MNKAMAAPEQSTATQPADVLAQHITELIAEATAGMDQASLPFT